MKKEEKYKREKEIEFWARHWDLDKYNYDRTQSDFISGLIMLMTLLIGGVTIINSFPGLDITTQNGAIITLRNFLIILISIFVAVNLYSMVRDYKTKIFGHKLDFMVRDEQLRRMYKRLIALDKRKLNKEFEKIKKDYLEGKIKLPYQEDERRKIKKKNS